METETPEDTWSFRLFVLVLFVIVLFIGVASVYYILSNTNWDAMDKNLAVTTRLFYVYSALVGISLFGALVWLVADERRIRKLTKQLGKEKAND